MNNYATYAIRGDGEMDIDLSPSDALKMFEEQAMGNVPEPEVKQEPAPAAAPVEKAEPEPASTPSTEPEPQGVATRDGKHVIPYSVLQSERTRAAAAERDLQEARTRLATLEASLLAPKSTAKPGGADTTEQDDEGDRLALLEEDFPTVAAELKAMRALVSKLDAKIQPIQKSTEDAEAQRVSQAAMTVQEAIDTLPKLAHIQSANPEAFSLATQFDESLRSRPDWADKPTTERFAKVLELVEASLGVIEVPGQKQPSAADQAALKKAAAEKLAAAPKAVPTSLSQFPAGEPVATDEAAAVAQMSTAQLASKLGRMTPAQMDAYFASL